MTDQPKYVLWQGKDGKWSRATTPLPFNEAERMRLAATASGKDTAYIVLPENATP